MTPDRRQSRNMMKNMFRESDDESNSDSSDDEIVKEELPPSNAPLTTPDDDTMAYSSICHDFQVVLKQDRKKGIAHQLWPAATFMSHYLEQHADTLLPPGTTVLELGAGIGLCGLVCHKLHAAAVILTDLPVAMPLLETNIRLNTIQEQDPTQQLVRPMVLSWGSDADLATVMATMEKAPGRLLCVAADCVYWEDLFEPFFHTVRALVVDHRVDVVLAHVKRWKRDERFFKMCRKHMNVIQLVEDVSMEPQEHTHERHRVIKRIFRLTAKA